MLVSAVWLFRLYLSTRRITRNLEEISGIVLNRVARPLSTLPPLMEVTKYVLGLVQEYRSRERRYENDDPE